MSTSITARELVLVTLLVLVTIGHLRRAPAAQAPRRLGERAWLLVVHARFQTLANVETFLGAFAPMASAVGQGEPDTLGYEVSASESDPLHLMIFERYRTKEAYLNVHKAMKHFLKFRPKLQELQDAKKVAISGESFHELGYGFM